MLAWEQDADDGGPVPDGADWESWDDWQAWEPDVLLAEAAALAPQLSRLPYEDLIREKGTFVRPPQAEAPLEWEDWALWEPEALLLEAALLTDDQLWEDD